MRRTDITKTKLGSMEAMMDNLIRCAKHGRQTDVICGQCYSELQAELEAVKVLIKQSRMNHGLCKPVGSCTRCLAVKELNKMGDELLKGGDDE